MMTLFDLVYWVHVSFGIATLPAGFAALFAVKGSPIHKGAGKIFLGLILVAAVTGGAFPLLPDSSSSLVFTWIALLSSLPAISAVLAWNRGPVGKIGDGIMTVLFAASAAGAALWGDGRPEAGSVAIWFAIFVVFDIWYFARGRPSGVPAERRHLARMLTAFVVGAISAATTQNAEYLPLTFDQIVRLNLILYLCLLAYFWWRAGHGDKAVLATT
jgi:uncharacterized membrane protein